MLLYRGIGYLAQDKLLPLTIVGIILGSLKSYLILNKSATKGVERIKRFGDNTCIGAVYSWRTWLLVLAMMLVVLVLVRVQASLPMLAPAMIVVVRVRAGMLMWVLLLVLAMMVVMLVLVVCRLGCKSGWCCWC